MISRDASFDRSTEAEGALHASVTSDDGEQTADAREQVGFYQLRGLFGLVMYCCGVTGAYFALADAVPARTMLRWVTVAIGWQVLSAVLIATMVLRKPDAAERNRFWWPLGHVLAFGSVAIFLWALFLFVPGADAVQRLSMTVFTLTFVSIAIMSGFHTVQLDRVATITATGVLAYLLVATGLRDTRILAVYVTAYGVFMLVLSRNIRRTERLIVESRAASQALALRLSVALDDARRERDARTRFLTSASHDLGQPLQAARLSFDQAVRFPAGEKRDRSIARAHGAFDWAEQLLTGMIEHLRLESGQAAARCDAVAAGPLLAAVAELHEAGARTTGTAIHVMPSALTVRGDATLIERAVSNFAANAIRHAKCRRILIGARRHGDKVRLWVIDNGRGVAEVDRARLFDDYSQGSDHGDEVRGGFGLGLASVRRVAELMGGSAGLDPHWTRGSAFWLELPRA